MASAHWLQRLERETAVDESLHHAAAAVRRRLERAPRLRLFLQGDWMDHPLHAAATDVPVGAFTCRLLLDALASARESRGLAQAADATAALGLVSAVAAAVPGIADWSYARGAARRVGALHGGSNLLGTGLYAASLIARRRGRRPLGIGLARAGFALLLLGAWLGGELTYRLGMGVREPR
jgi:uncharacterized membrane protein